MSFMSIDRFLFCPTKGLQCILYLIAKLPTFFIKIVQRSLPCGIANMCYNVKPALESDFPPYFQ